MIYSYNDESSLICLRAECVMGDLDCILNRTRIIQYLHLALPTIRRLTSPAILVTVESHDGIGMDPSLDFVILSGNRHGRFDMVLDRDDNRKGMD